ncbi:hypothetical protein BESB_007380 [Besnoitia besnoiti]|uniref:Uncharacterized protein n=1 Tax=Besnoitia besnoiti TaxID=94643 RepID=A0A2A9MPT6_BESBE|nr:hypothetical protein BESB_007380 [Besnoitia besnoiti]PFH38396.1 hypothetical protein BESB_007380 [Besnoitia besnoiti]
MKMLPALPSLPSDQSLHADSRPADSSDSVFAWTECPSIAAPLACCPHASPAAATGSKRKEPSEAAAWREERATSCSLWDHDGRAKRPRTTVSARKTGEENALTARAARERGGNGEEGNKEHALRDGKPPTSPASGTRDPHTTTVTARGQREEGASEPKGRQRSPEGCGISPRLRRSSALQGQDDLPSDCTTGAPESSSVTTSSSDSLGPGSSGPPSPQKLTPPQLQPPPPVPQAAHQRGSASPPNTRLSEARAAAWCWGSETGDGGRVDAARTLHTAQGSPSPSSPSLSSASAAAPPLSPLASASARAAEKQHALGLGAGLPARRAVDEEREDVTKKHTRLSVSQQTRQEEAQGGALPSRPRRQSPRIQALTRSVAGAERRDSCPAARPEAAAGGGRHTPMTAVSGRSHAEASLGLPSVPLEKGMTAASLVVCLSPSASRPPSARRSGSRRCDKRAAPRPGSLRGTEDADTVAKSCCAPGGSESASCSSSLAPPASSPPACNSSGAPSASACASSACEPRLPSGGAASCFDEAAPAAQGDLQGTSATSVSPSLPHCTRSGTRVSARLQAAAAAQSSDMSALSAASVPSVRPPPARGAALRRPQSAAAEAAASAVKPLEKTKNAPGSACRTPPPSDSSSSASSSPPSAASPPASRLPEEILRQALLRCAIFFSSLELVPCACALPLHPLVNPVEVANLSRLRSLIELSSASGCQSLPPRKTSHERKGAVSSPARRFSSRSQVSAEFSSPAKSSQHSASQLASPHAAASPAPLGDSSTRLSVSPSCPAPSPLSSVSPSVSQSSAASGSHASKCGLRALRAPSSVAPLPPFASSYELVEGMPSASTSSPGFTSPLASVDPYPLNPSASSFASPSSSPVPASAERRDEAPVERRDSGAAGGKAAFGGDRAGPGETSHEGDESAPARHEETFRDRPPAASEARCGEDSPRWGRGPEDEGCAGERGGDDRQASKLGIRQTGDASKKATAQKNAATASRARPAERRLAASESGRQRACSMSLLPVAEKKEAKTPQGDSQGEKSAQVDRREADKENIALNQELRLLDRIREEACETEAKESRAKGNGEEEKVGSEDTESKAGLPCSRAGGRKKAEGGEGDEGANDAALCKPTDGREAPEERRRSGADTGGAEISHESNGVALLSAQETAERSATRGRSGCEREKGDSESAFEPAAELGTGDAAAAGLTEEKPETGEENSTQRRKGEMTTGPDSGGQACATRPRVLFSDVAREALKRLEGEERGRRAGSSCRPRAPRTPLLSVGQETCTPPRRVLRERKPHSRPGEEGESEQKKRRRAASVANVPQAAPSAISNAIDLFDDGSGVGRQRTLNWLRRSLRNEMVSPGVEGFFIYLRRYSSSGSPSAAAASPAASFHFVAGARLEMIQDGDASLSWLFLPRGLSKEAEEELLLPFFVYVLCIFLLSMPYHLRPGSDILSPLLRSLQATQWRRKNGDAALADSAHHSRDGKANLEGEADRTVAQEESEGKATTAVEAARGVESTEPPTAVKKSEQRDRQESGNSEQYNASADDRGDDILASLPEAICLPHALYRAIHEQDDSLRAREPANEVERERSAAGSHSAKRVCREYDAMQTTSLSSASSPPSPAPSPTSEARQGSREGCVDTAGPASSSKDAHLPSRPLPGSACVSLSTPEPALSSASSLSTASSLSSASSAAFGSKLPSASCSCESSSSSGADARRPSAAPVVPELRPPNLSCRLMIDCGDLLLCPRPFLWLLMDKQPFARGMHPHREPDTLEPPEVVRLQQEMALYASKLISAGAVSRRSRDPHACSAFCVDVGKTSRRGRCSNAFPLAAAARHRRAKGRGGASGSQAQKERQDAHEEEEIAKTSAALSQSLREGGVFHSDVLAGKACCCQLQQAWPLRFFIFHALELVFSILPQLMAPAAPRAASPRSGSSPCTSPEGSTSTAAAPSASTDCLCLRFYPSARLTEELNRLLGSKKAGVQAPAALPGGRRNGEGDKGELFNVDTLRTETPSGSAQLAYTSHHQLQQQLNERLWTVAKVETFASPFFD